MKTKVLFPLFVATALVSGCQSYVYRVVRPSGVAQPIANQPIIINYDPLEYSLIRTDGRLAMRINNPTDDRIVLLGNRSYVIDPREESHPLRSLVIGSHSFARMLLPPERITFMTHGWGGWGPYSPGDPFFFDFYPPAIFYTEIRTPYDWEWSKGPARIHLSYERNRKLFDHDFEIIREPEKR